MTLSPEELAYMRQTQAEARPRAADLVRVDRGRTPTGGQVAVLTDPEPTRVRVSSGPEAVPQVIAARYERDTLATITLDMLADVRDGDSIVMGPTEAYEVVSVGTTDEWATAQQVIARRTVWPNGRRG